MYNSFPPHAGTFSGMKEDKKVASGEKTPEEALAEEIKN